MIYTEDLENLGFNNIGDIMDSVHFKNYVRKRFEEENKNKVSNNIHLLDSIFKNGIPPDKISILAGQSGVGKSYFDMIPDFVIEFNRIKKINKIYNKINIKQT